MKLFGYEITINKVHRKRGKNLLGARRWTASEINTAMRLQNEGKAYKEIGKMLNRTPQAIQIKLSHVRASLKEK